jgi:hypothetical protein
VDADVHGGGAGGGVADGGHVPAVATDAAVGGLVPQHGVLGVDWVILRHERVPVDSVSGYLRGRAARVVAISKFV